MGMINPIDAQRRAHHDVLQVVRAHDEAANLSIRNPNHPVMKLLKPIFWRYTHAKRPDLSYIDQALKEIEGIFGKRSNTVLISTTGDLSDERLNIEREYISVIPNSKIQPLFFTIKNTSLYVKESHVAISETVLFKISKHVVDRLHLRSEENSSSGLRDIARSVVDNIGLMHAMLARAQGTDLGRIALPFDGGLVLGDCDERAHEQIATYGEVRRFGVNHRYIFDYKAPDLVPRCTIDEMVFTSPKTLSRPEIIDAGCRSGSGLGLMMRTFIGRSELYRGQAELRDTLLNIQERYADVVGNKLFYSLVQTGWEGLGLSERRYKDMCAEVDRLFENPAFIIAMGNTPVAEARFGM